MVKKVRELNSNISKFICEKLEVSFERTISGSTYTFTGTITSTDSPIIGLFFIGFVATSSPVGPCDIAIGLFNNVVDTYRTYQNISFTKKNISSYSLTPVDTKTITVTVTSSVPVGSPSIGYINVK